MNLPNKITLTRLIAVIGMVACAAVPPRADDGHLLWWRLGFVIAILGGVSDWLDGYLARKYDLVTDFGKLMDPLADKIFTVSGFVILSERGIVPGWVTIVILMREFAVTGLRGVAGKKGVVIAASWAAKCKTVFQMLVLLVGGTMWIEALGLSPSTSEHWWWHVTLWVLGAYTVYTGVEYYWKGRELYLKDA